MSHCFKQLQRTSNLKSSAVKTKKVTHRVKENLSLRIFHDPFEKRRPSVNMSIFFLKLLFNGIWRRALKGNSLDQL